MGQHFDTFAVKLIPKWFDVLPLLESTERYFKQGVFDWADLAAIAVGSILAYWILVKTVKNGEKQ